MTMRRQVAAMQLYFMGISRDVDIGWDFSSSNAGKEGGIGERETYFYRLMISKNSISWLRLTYNSFLVENVNL